MGAPLSVENILTRLDAAFKSITAGSLGNTKMSAEKSDRFVRAVENSTPMLREARRIDMATDTRDIDKTGFGGRIMQAGVENTAPGATTDPTFTNNKLVAVEAIAVVGVTDSALEDNIEGDGFENTLIDMMGERAGVDLEELYVKGDKTSGDTYLALTDGWVKKAANAVSGACTDTGGGGNSTLTAAAGAGTVVLPVVTMANFGVNDWVRIGAGWTQEYGRISAVDVPGLKITLTSPVFFNHAIGEAVVEITAAPGFNRFSTEDMFEAMLNALPKKYLRDRGQWRLYVHWDIENAYRDQVRARGTALGDTAQTTAQPLTYKGIPVVPVANLASGSGVLAHPDNLVYGIHRDVKIERERLPKLRRTDFVLTVRVDCNYEDTQAAVVASGWVGL